MSLNMIKYVFAIVLFIFFYSSANSQVFTGTTVGQFLKIDVGAKSVALGGAFVAVANDASTIYWNPAGISRLQSHAAMFSHTYWLANTNHDFAGVIINIGEQHAIGLSYTLLGMEDMKVRTEIYPEGTGEFFNASDYALGISYALNLTKDFSIGFTGKYIGEKIWHMTATAIAFDVGVLYQTPITGLNLGMSVSNIGSKMKFEGEDNFVYYTYNPDEHGNNDKIFAEIAMDEWDLPLLYRVGLSYITFNTDLHKFQLSIDANHPNDYSESINVGGEYGFKERLFLRGGYKALFKEDSEEGLCAGVGLLYYLSDFVPVKIDYAFSYFGRLKDIHRISMEINF